MVKCHEGQVSVCEKKSRKFTEDWGDSPSMYFFIFLIAQTRMEVLELKDLQLKSTCLLPLV